MQEVESENDPVFGDESEKLTLSPCPRKELSSSSPSKRG
jgi:hypothetical protein